MAVVIRLSRVGATHQSKYRITVADSRKHATGKFLEILGYYNPKAQGKDKPFEIDLDKVNAWIKKGAQPSDRIRSILRLAGQKA
jgi:small subunit ribosomal protein S16